MIYYNLALGVIISYLIGSIPTAYIFGRLIKGIDIRKHGSGNVGATNALRVLGKGPGITVLILDILKGAAAVVFLGNILSAGAGKVSGELLRVILGVSCVAGHNWTVFLQFKGGKGIATTLGVLLGLAITLSALKIVLGLAVLTWLIIFLMVRIVSLASVLSAVSLPIYMLVFKESYVLIVASTFLSLLTLLRHKSNIQRLIHGQERRVSFRKAKKALS